jgi:type I restriction enzyme, S subunit
MSELPDGWIWVTIEEIGEVVTGSTPLKKNPDFFGGDIPFYKPTDLNAGYKVVEAREYLSQSGAAQSRLLPPLSTLVTCIGTMGKAGLARTTCATNQQINAIIPVNELINPYWLYRTVTSPFIQRNIIDNSSSTTISILNKGRFSKLIIPLPPLKEQKRIADKLDRLLAKVDNCRERLDRIPLLLKKFRQAVLISAFSGKLTEDWRETISDFEPVSKLLNRLSVKQKKDSYSEFMLPDTWGYLPIDKIGNVFLGRQRSPKYHTGEDMHPYVRAANITWQGWNFSDVKEMNFDSRDFERYKLQIGDVLINEGSGSANEVGKPAIWNGEIENCCFQNTLICVRPHERMSKYLYFVCLHTALSKAFVEETRGVNIFHIGKERFSNFMIPLPPLEEQFEIVRRIERLFDFADRLEVRYQTARAQIDKLTPALLDKAFKGELVPQDPADEPAAALLAKIQRISTKPKTTRKSKQ